MPEILGRRIEYDQRPWLTIEAKDVDLGPPRGVETFYSVGTRDYAAVLAVTDDGRMPLVRQYRPAVEEWTLELPSGLIDAGETPEQAIRRELLEETGCEAGEIVDLGRFHLDSGRMSTRQHAFFAGDVKVIGAPSGEEQDLEVVFIRSDELAEHVRAGSFRMAGHLGIAAAAAMQGLVSL
jgi:8-oxo-dGTP pyrophosphatase MutT (NUDIX family)